jgi:hypothetical protein
VFGVFIVDASIFVATALCSIPGGALPLWGVRGGVCSCRECVPQVFCCGVCLWCLASYEGHMVDALASRADEGRSSLR